MNKHTPFAVACLLCILVGLVPAATAENPAEEDWFVLLNGEDRIGYMHITEATADNGDITSGQTIKIVMARAGTRVEIEVGSSFVESAEGEPITARSTMTMGGVPIVTEVEFGEKALKVTSGQGGRMNTTMKRPIEGDWMPPAAMGRYVQAQLAAGAQTIETRTVDVSSGLTPIDMTMQVRGQEDVEVYGKVVPAIVWDATASVMPGVAMREYVDDEGKSIKSTIPLMPGMEITVLRADKALALSELTPAEMMAQTFVVPSRKIEKPRELKRANYVLRLKGGAGDVSLPDLRSQYVYNPGDTEAGVIIVTEDGHFPAGMPHRDFAEDDLERYLRASPVLNHEDPELWELVSKWETNNPRVADKTEKPSAYAVALVMRDAVYDLIQKKDLSVGFATASDVARTKQGDCTEHAVLLAALLRGVDIPSRCVSGLVYADQFAGHEGIFGYHMWTQAWIANEKPSGGFGDGDGLGPGGGGRWIDFDATLPDGVRFDATHIALSVSDMNDGVMGNDMAALLPLLGNLEIEVVETVYDDE